MAAEDRDFAKIADILIKNDDFIIFTHSYPDGDGIGSSIAFYKLLINIGKKAVMACEGELPYQYEFMPYFKNIINDISGLSAKDNFTAIFLDCADIKRAKIDEKGFLKKAETVINIDHHLSNSSFGDINVVDSSKSATAEIIFLFFEKYFKKYIDNDIAVSLYTGILTDTGKFQYSNTTREVHRIISLLLDYGIYPSEIYNRIYEQEPANRFKLLSLVLKRVKLDTGNCLIHSYILKKDFKKYGLPFSSNDGMIELLRAAKDVKVAALFKETGRNHYKVSLRSSYNDINVADIAQSFGGGGHKSAAAFSFYGRRDIIVKDLEKAIVSSL